MSRSVLSPEIIPEFLTQKCRGVSRACPPSSRYRSSEAPEHGPPCSHDLVSAGNVNFLCRQLRLESVNTMNERKWRGKRASRAGRESSVRLLRQRALRAERRSEVATDSSECDFFSLLEVASNFLWITPVQNHDFGYEVNRQEESPPSIRVPLSSVGVLQLEPFW